MTADYKLRRMAQTKEVSAAKRKAGLTYPVCRNREAYFAALEQLKRIPPDTRDLTGRLMGDPLPGRSALDRSQSA